jgi:hypothetical protein
MIGVDHALAVEHDEKLIAIALAMIFMPRTWLKHGPANHMIGAGGFLIDQELYLHIDPAVIALKAFDLRYVAQVRAIYDWRFLAFFPFGGSALHGLRQRGAAFFLLRS